MTTTKHIKEFLRDISVLPQSPETYIVVVSCDEHNLRLYWLKSVKYTEEICFW